MTNTYFHKHPFTLESGEQLSEVQVTYTTLGKLNDDQSNVVWICHALTGNSNPESWWTGLVGQNKLYNPNDYFIICANVIGSCYGSTGPLSINSKTNQPYYHAFPHLTIRDIVAGLELLSRHLGITQVNTLIGGSLGGQQALEWAISSPNKFKNVVLLATNSKHSPWGIAFNETQRMAIAADSTWKRNTADAGLLGLKSARAIALLSYRNYQTYSTTQKDTNNKTDGFNAASYQQYQGNKFINRFNAYSYWVLSKAMDSHDVSRGRNSVQQALKRIKAKTLIIGIESDVLFPVSESKLLADYIPNANFKSIESLYGHDGFLLETEIISALINQNINQNTYNYEHN